jgi:hypothetical protein
MSISYLNVVLKRYTSPRNLSSNLGTVSDKRSFFVAVPVETK